MTNTLTETDPADELIEDEADETPEEEVTEEEDDNLEEDLEEFRRRLARTQRRFDNTRRISKAIGWVALALMIVALVAVGSPRSMAVNSTVVLTGSMAPYLEIGDIARTVEHDPHKRLEVGDVAVVEHEDGGTYLHRVIAVNDDGTYTTKGDNSDLPDLLQPTDAQIGGVLFNVIRQPEATYYSLFQGGSDWLPAVGTAISQGDWETVSILLPVGPWGWLILFVVSLFGLLLVPMLLNRRIDKINLREAIELERLKRSVATHEDAITEHEDSLAEHDETFAEVVPVVEEIVHEREREKALLEESALAQEAAWSNWDPNAPIYDEPEEDLFTSTDEAVEESNPFLDAYEDQEEEALPAAFAIDDDEETVVPFPTIKPTNLRGPRVPLPDPTPRFMQNEEVVLPEPVNPFAAIAANGRQSAPVATSGDSLRDELPALVSMPVTRPSQSRLAHSAFDLEEI